MNAATALFQFQQPIWLWERLWTRRRFYACVKSTKTQFCAKWKNNKSVLEMNVGKFIQWFPHKKQKKKHLLNSVLMPINRSTFCYPRDIKGKSQLGWENWKGKHFCLNSIVNCLGSNSNVWRENKCFPLCLYCAQRTKVMHVIIVMKKSSFNIVRRTYTR